MNGGMYPHEETMALIQRAQAGDAAAQETLVAANLALVKSVVRGFLGRGVEYDDLFQLGSVGLVKAIRRFDPAYNVRFSTYAVPMIAGEIKRFLRDDGAVKVSRSVKELATRAAAAEEQIREETGREAGVAEIAERLGVDAADVAVALDANRPVISLNEQLFDDDNGTDRMDFLADPQTEGKVVDRMLLKELLGQLQGRDRQLIILRYFHEKTQTEIAEIFGVSQVQISRLESRILQRLRASSTEQGKT